MRYIGGGFITGIPARNLTDREVVKYGKRRLLQSGLYTYKEINDKKKQPLLKEGGNEWQMV